jgi:hypothetical protein
MKLSAQIQKVTMIKNMKIIISQIMHIIKAAKEIVKKMI